jgi:flavin reductase (DIM6/NTAB) family NADH-FMN oxidoreductase RutF
MPTYNPETTNARHFFQLFSGALVPRPIAWITSINQDGSLNLAPYSFFGGINTRPPMVMVSIGTHEGELKHTGENIIRNKECVIHIPSRSHIDAVNKSAHKYELNVSEIEQTGLNICESAVIQTPSIDGTFVRIECRLNQTIDLPTNQMFLFDVVSLYLDDSILNQGIPDVKVLDPISRIGGNFYTTVGEVLQKIHPDKEE